MVDLDVYRLAGSVLLSGGNFYDLPGPLQFLYPPFAAVLAVPLALLPQAVVQIGWTAAGALALVAVLHRSGLTGWVLSLVATAAIFFVAAGAADPGLRPTGHLPGGPGVPRSGPRAPGVSRRLLPEGALTALAAAIKLTPAIFVVYLLLVGKRRAFWVAVGTGLLVTLASAAIVPSASYEFWGRLVRGDTGLGGSIIYYTNQSVMADVVRIFGLGPGGGVAGLAGCALVALGGLWAAVLWHRLGDVRLAVTLCGLAGLLASPVSWLHHFVWVVPFAICLADGSDPRAGQSTPDRSAGSAAGRIPGARLGVRRLGGRRAVPPTAQRRRRRTAVDLVATSARLGDRDPGRGAADRRDRHRPSVAGDPLPALTRAATSVPGLVGEKADHHGRPPE